MVGRSRTDITGPTVMTVLGPVSADALGRALVHEHVKIAVPGASLDPYSRQSRREQVHRAVDRLSELKDYGVGTFVDPCPIELGRDVELMAEVSERSGVNIVCSTGFYYETEGIGIPYYWRMRWPEEIAEFYIDEIQRGIESTGIRPGVIKAASGKELGHHEEKVLTGAAQASAATGLPIITHTTGSRCGTAQQRIFTANGVDLARCLIGHQDEGTPADLAKVADNGSFVGIDRVGYETLVPDAARVELAISLIDAGHGDRLCLSQDHLCVGGTARPTFWRSKDTASDIDRTLLPKMKAQSYARSSAHIFTAFVPRLIEAGMSEDLVDRIFVDNPRRFLTGVAD